MFIECKKISDAFTVLSAACGYNETTKACDVSKITTAEVVDDNTKTKLQEMQAALVAIRNQINYLTKNENGGENAGEGLHAAAFCKADAANVTGHSAINSATGGFVSLVDPASVTLGDSNNAVKKFDYNNDSGYEFTSSATYNDASEKTYAFRNTAAEMLALTGESGSLTGDKIKAPAPILTSDKGSEAKVSGWFGVFGADAKDAEHSKNTAASVRIPTAKAVVMNTTGTNQDQKVAAFYLNEANRGQIIKNGGLWFEMHKAIGDTELAKVNKANGGVDIPAIAVTDLEGNETIRGGNLFLVQDAKILGSKVNNADGVEEGGLPKANSENLAKLDAPMWSSTNDSGTVKNNPLKMYTETHKAFKQVEWLSAAEGKEWFVAKGAANFKAVTKENKKTSLTNFAKNSANGLQDCCTNIANNGLNTPFTQLMGANMLKVADESSIKEAVGFTTKVLAVAGLTHKGIGTSNAEAKQLGDANTADYTLFTGNSANNLWRNSQFQAEAPLVESTLTLSDWAKEVDPT